MSYLLDTNIVSETARRNPNKAVIAWIESNLIPDDLGSSFGSYRDSLTFRTCFFYKVLKDHLPVPICKVRVFSRCGVPKAPAFPPQSVVPLLYVADKHPTQFCLPLSASIRSEIAQKVDDYL